MLKIATTLAIAAVSVATGAAAPEPRIGDIFQIATDRETEQKGNREDSQRSTSTDRDAYVERVVAVRPDGVVLEYDLPGDATADDRKNNWQFPFQVLKANDGSVRLLSASELASRVDQWLRAGGIPRSACGRLIFTWNAFRIECDPQSTLQWLNTVTLPERLQVGDPLSDPDARESAKLRQVAGGALAATLLINPEIIRQQRAETNVGVAELTRRVLTLEAALKAHAAETIKGTITVTFDLNHEGQPWRRTRVEATQVSWPNGRVDTQTVTYILMRRPLSRDSLAL